MDNFTCLSEKDKHIKVLCIGNSILKHPPASQLGWYHDWGMAATCEENDYFHVMQKLLKQDFPDWCAEFELAPGYNFESSVDISTDKDYTGILEQAYGDKMKNFLPDIVTFQVGDNVKNYTEDSYCYAICEFVKYCRKYNPDITVILTETLSGGKTGKISIALRRAAKEMLCPYISLYKYKTPENLALGLFEHPGVAGHPGDKGMYEIAKAYYRIIRNVLLTRQNKSNILVKAEGDDVEFPDALPIVSDGQIYLPLENILNVLGGSYTIEGNTYNCCLEHDNTVSFILGENILHKDEKVIALSVGTFISDNCIYVPIEFFENGFGCVVNYIKNVNYIDICKSVEEIVSTRSEIEGAVITLADAENKTGGYKIYHGSCELLFVPNPEDERDTVFYLKSTARPDFPSWTYFWCEATGKLVPSRRYKVSFDLMHTQTVTGFVPKTTVAGINFVYHDTAIPGVIDHNKTPCGKNGEFEIVPGKWTHVEYIYTIPETFDVTKSSCVGIYSYPYMTKEAISFYLDDVSIVPYCGELEDGINKCEII